MITSSTWRRALRRSVPAALAATVLTTAVIGPATASPVSKSPDTMWQVDGRVDALTYSPDGNTIYLGGTFGHLCPPLQAVCDGTGPSDITMPNLAAINATTGAPITTFIATPDGEVTSLALTPDGTRLYIGGMFNNVNGTSGMEAHRKLAVVNASTGQAVRTWKPVVNAAVGAVALSPDASTVYFGGPFTKVNGITRVRLAAASAYSSSASSFTLLPWDPAPSGSTTFDKKKLMPPNVNSLWIHPGGDVYAGGVFTTIAGQARNNVAALSPAVAGAAVARPFTVTPQLDYVVLTLSGTRDGSTVFANGRGPGGFVWALDSATGQRRWNRQFDGDVQAAVATDTLVYIGGHFDNITNSGTSIRDERHHIAALSAFTGKTDPFNPRANSTYGVYGMAFSPGHLAVGGDFTLINSIPHEGIAQFSGGDTVAPAAVNDLTATSVAKGRVDLSWSPVADADSATLVYYVYRRTGTDPFRILAQVDGPSAAGTGPLTYADTAVTIGSSYEYRVRAADPVFLAPVGASSAATVVGDQAPPAVPTGVSATSPSPGNVDVTFTAGGDADDTTLSYLLTRSDGVTRTVSGPALGTVTVRDVTPVAGGTFSYTVRASDGTFTSAASSPSAPVTVAADVATPTVPTGVSATSPAADTVTVTWNAASDADTPTDQLQYNVYRKASSSAGSGGTVPLAVTAPGETSFTDVVAAGTGLLADKNFTYYVQAVDGPRSSAKSAPAGTGVSSAIFSDPFTSLDAWTLSPGGGVTLDSTGGSPAAPSAQLSASLAAARFAYATRSFAPYRTVCVQERVSMTLRDNRSTGQTTLLRVYSSTGNDISRIFVDNMGKVWVRGDWASYPVITSSVIPLDGSWHTVQLCTTTTADGVNGTIDAWYDGVKIAQLTGLDNATDPLASVQIGDVDARTFTMRIDDVQVGTTPR